MPFGRIWMGWTNQRLQWLEIFEFVIADAEMGQIRALLEGAKAVADTVVAQFELLQLRQLRETLQTFGWKEKDFVTNCKPALRRLSIHFGMFNN